MSITKSIVMPIGRLLDSQEEPGTTRIIRPHCHPIQQAAGGKGIPMEHAVDHSDSLCTADVRVRTEGAVGISKHPAAIHGRQDLTTPTPHGVGFLVITVGNAILCGNWLCWGLRSGMSLSSKKGNPFLAQLYRGGSPCPFEILDSTNTHTAGKQMSLKSLDFFIMKDHERFVVLLYFILNESV